MLRRLSWLLVGALALWLALLGLPLGGSVEAETCLSPFVKRLDRAEKVLYVFCVDADAKDNDFLAVIALRHRERLIARARAIAARNLATLERWIEEREGLTDWVPPRGGLLGLLRYHLDVSSRELADRLAAEASVMLAPGSAFGFEGHLRIGLGAEPGHFAEGLRVAATFLEDLATQRKPAR